MAAWQRHWNCPGPGGGSPPPLLPGHRGLVVLGVRRQSGSTEEGGHGGHAGQPAWPASWPPSRTRWPTDTASAFRAGLPFLRRLRPSCRRPITPTPPWSPPSWPPLWGDPAVHGDGCQTRDFTFVGTVTAVLVDGCAQVTSDRPFNLAFGSRVSLLELIAILEGQLGKELTRTHSQPRPGGVRTRRPTPPRSTACSRHEPVPLPEASGPPSTR